MNMWFILTLNPSKTIGKLDKTMANKQNTQGIKRMMILVYVSTYSRKPNATPNPGKPTRQFLLRIVT